MGKLDTIMNLAVWGGVGFLAYKLFPTGKRLFNLVSSGIDKINDVTDPSKSFLNPSNWGSEKQGLDKLKPNQSLSSDGTITTYDSWADMSYNRALELGVVDEWRTYNKLDDMKKSKSGVVTQQTPSTPSVSNNKMDSVKDTKGNTYLTPSPKKIKLSDNQINQLVRDGKSYKQIEKEYGKQ